MEELNSGNEAKTGPQELTTLQKDGIAARLANNPIIEFMGIQLLEVTVGKAALLLPHRGVFHNSLGSVQGGILAVLADVAGGVSLYSVLPDPLRAAIPTIEFKLNFLRPAAKGDLLARGKVVHHGRQVAVCQTDVFSNNEALLATGIFTYMIKNVADTGS
jgi:uncharacterized protein (TIGR00369 family)